MGRPFNVSLLDDQQDLDNSVNNNQGVETSETPTVIDGEKASNFTSSLVLSVFPVLGKSTYSKEHEDSVDLESSLYSRKQDNSFNEEFPGNYINLLKWHLVNNNWKYVFVSSHKVVRDAMKNDGIKFYIIYPSLDRKDEILNLARERGNTEEFINKLSECWEAWINEVSQEENAYELKSGEFISDDVFKEKLKFLVR